MLNSTKIDKALFIRLQEQLKIENRHYKELINSKLYRTLNLLKDFFGMFKSIQSCKNFIKTIKTMIYGKYSSFKYPLYKSKQSDRYNVSYFSNDKFIIYTAIFGNYDLPQEPLFCPDNCEFYIFTDQDIPRTSIWEIKSTKDLGENFIKMSNTNKNRFCKMFPHKLFPNIKYSIYIDGNIKPISDFTEFINISSDYGLLAHAHKSRNCVYEEMKACKIMHKGNLESIKKYENYLKESKFPIQYGMLECNVLIRDHSNLIMQKIMEEWWNEFLSSKTNRDQLSLPYVLWKNSISVDKISKLGVNTGYNDALRIMQHNL